MKNILAFAAIVSFAVSSPAEAKGPSVKVQETANPSVTVGTVEVNAPPAKVRAALGDLGSWPRLFRDIALAQSVEGRPRTWRMESRSVGHAHVFCAEQGPTTVTVTQCDGEHGADMQQRFIVRPGSRQDTTIVSAELRFSVSGLFGLFVSETTLREKRQKKLRSDLEDLSHRL